MLTTQIKKHTNFLSIITFSWFWHALYSSAKTWRLGLRFWKKVMVIFIPYRILILPSTLLPVVVLRANTQQLIWIYFSLLIFQNWVHPSIWLVAICILQTCGICKSYYSYAWQVWYIASVKQIQGLNHIHKDYASALTLLRSEQSSSCFILNLRSVMYDVKIATYNFRKCSDRLWISPSCQTLLKAWATSPHQRAKLNIYIFLFQCLFYYICDFMDFMERGMLIPEKKLVFCY